MKENRATQDLFESDYERLIGDIAGVSGWPFSTAWQPSALTHCSATDIGKFAQSSPVGHSVF